MHPFFSEEPECVFWFVHLRILRLGLIGSEQFSSTYFMLFQPVSPMHNCIRARERWLILTTNSPLDRKLSAKSSCRAIFIKHKLPLEQFYNVWTKCLIFQLKPTFEIGSSLSFWHNRLSQVKISVLQFYPQGILLRWRWNPARMEWVGDQTETLHLKASEPPWVYHGIDFAREIKLYCRKLRNID